MTNESFDCDDSTYCNNRYGGFEMARADLLKKLFSNYKTGDREGFLKIVDEIIEDEKKKNHAILADELRMIISNGSTFPSKGLSTYSAQAGNGYPLCSKNHRQIFMEHNVKIKNGGSNFVDMEKLTIPHYSQTATM
jgi:hypothetical protein